QGREGMRGRRGARGTPPPQQPQTQAAARPNPLEEFWQKQTPEQWRDRAEDVRLVVDSLSVLEQQFPELQGKMDHATIGVAGHSYGALTALLEAGMRTFGSPAIDFAGSRVKAVIAMEPPALSEGHGITAQSFANLHVPVLFISITDENGAFESSPAGDKYSVRIAGGGPMTFTGMGGFRGGFDRERPVQTSTGTYARQQMPQTAVSVGPGAAFQTIEITSLAFWDAYLKNETSARDLLQPEKYNASFSGATLTRK
ncbi:MAG TPA: hypothetical protein VKH35_11710, partial [Thermoanaerobaculia bacterium]|nr:hypothetical protein [Thermoanaerobaculia bacterium]